MVHPKSMWRGEKIVVAYRMTSVLLAIGVIYCMTMSVNGTTEIILLISKPDLTGGIRTTQCFLMIITMMIFYSSASIFGVIWPICFALFGLKMSKELHRRIFTTAIVSTVLTIVFTMITLMILVDGELKRNYSATTYRRGFI